MVDLTDNTFAQHTSEGFSVIDFWAEWCGPCRAVAPAFAQTAENLSAKAQFAKLNVDNAPAVAGAHGVMSIPTILVLRDGKEVGRIVGARSADQLQREIESLLV
jgi:thioredoxin